MSKQSRHLAIREVIVRQSIASQDELRKELKRQGYNVTQATLSRDLRDLGVNWITTEQGGRYALSSSAEATILRPIVRAEVVSITSNDTVVVIKTLPGCANTVSEFIDVQKNPDIIGTLAGDNTLLVIPASSAATK